MEESSISDKDKCFHELFEEQVKRTPAALRRCMKIRA